MNRLSSLSRRLFLAASVFAFVLQACTLTLFENPFGSISTTATPGAVIATNTPYPVAQTTFVVTLPEALQPGETLVLAVIDEVTGANTNVTQYPMAPRDSLTYAGTLAVPYNSVVKYRYMRIGPGQVVEDTTLGTAIRYRMYFAAGPGEVRDIIGGWSGKTLQVASGTILGQVFNADTNTPVPNILVTAGGVQHLTDSFGRFELGGLAVGTHQLVAYSLDGFYVPFEQGAVVSGGSTTIVDLRIKPTRLVNVTFVVSVPQNTVPGVPVRIAGNLLQLGNAFADLQGGINTVPDRMPILSLQADGRYAMTMGLPVGTYIQYKYTLGDGFWNAEHKPGGEWLLREFIVPGQDTTIQDSVASWQATQESAPILYEVTAPSVTPPGDIVYIQFNAFGWTEPVPMWPLGNNRWAYKLYSPLNFFGNVVYRYCRNGQCGSADDNQTVGPAPTGRQSTTSILDQDIQDGVNSWKWYENPETYPLVGNAITPRSAGFVAGVEYQDAYRPNYSYYAPQAYANTKALGANLVIFSPSWTFSSISPLRFGTVPGQDPLWIDSAIMISQARTLGLNAAIFPTPHFPPASDTATPASAAFWKNAPRDAAWWQNFFTRYRAFLVNYADLANQTGAQSIILGGDWITPALPGGTLSDGTSSNVPADAEAQWRAIIQDVRSRFKGQVFWAMPYSKAGFQSPVNFIRDVDAIYLLWSVPVATSQTATKTDYANEVGRLLDTEVQPMTNLLGKPLIIAAAYPSASGAASGCISNGAGGCVDFPALSMPNADIPAVGLNLQTQADIYEAMLIAINSRPWVAGFVSRGYFMPVALQDKSTSIHSKPAADVLWYWFPRMLGTIK